MINLSSISGHQFFPPAILSHVPRSKISDSFWKSIPVHIPGKKSPSLIKRIHVLWGLNVYIHSFIEKEGFSGFMLQLKSKSICPATPNKPAAWPSASFPWLQGPLTPQPILGSPSIGCKIQAPALPPPLPHPWAAGSTWQNAPRPLESPLASMFKRQSRHSESLFLFFFWVFKKNIYYTLNRNPQETNT